MSKFDDDRSGPKSQTIWAILVIAIGLAGIGFMGYLNFDKGPTLDKVTLCPDKVTSVTAILIDASDELSPVQREDVQNRLDAVKMAVPKYGRIDLYAMGIEQDGLIRPLFSMCNPGIGGGNSLTETAHLMKRRWEREFSQKLDSELLKVLVVKEQAQSPIMEAIKAVAVQSFGRMETANADDKTLVIVSDMIQNAGGYNQYKDGRPFEEYAKGDHFKQTRTELRGVMVDLIYVRRTTSRNVQGVQHRVFWEKFFRASGGKMANFAPI